MRAFRRARRSIAALALHAVRAFAAPQLLDARQIAFAAPIILNVAFGSPRRARPTPIPDAGIEIGRTVILAALLPVFMRSARTP